MKCQNCGFEHEKETKFCTHCGAPNPAFQQAPGTDAAAESRPAGQQPAPWGTAGSGAQQPAPWGTAGSGAQQPAPWGTAGSATQPVTWAAEGPAAQQAAQPTPAQPPLRNGQQTGPRELPHRHLRLSRAAA